MYRLFIFCQIYGRPSETFAMLKTLTMSSIADYISTFLIYNIIHPSITEKELYEFVAKTGLNNYIIENQRIKVPYAENYRKALSIFRYNEYDYFISIDNDVIFNPGWFDILMKIKNDAEHDGNKIGILNPINVSHGSYKAKEKPLYIIKQRMAGSVQVIIAEAAKELPINIDDKMWKKRPLDWSICDYLTQKGYIHICPLNSYAQHIGKRGNGMTERAWNSRDRGGKGFIPDESIIEYWRQFNA